MPKAVHGLPAGSARSWPAVWARVQRSPLPRALPRLSFYLSLTGVVFTLAAALPGRLGIQPMAATQLPATRLRESGTRVRSR